MRGEGGRGGRKSKVEGKWALLLSSPAPLPPFFRSPSPPQPPPSPTKPPHHFFFSFFSVFRFDFFLIFLFFLGEDGGAEDEGQVRSAPAFPKPPPRSCFTPPSPRTSKPLPLKLPSCLKSTSFFLFPFFAVFFFFFFCFFVVFFFVVPVCLLGGVNFSTA